MISSDFLYRVHYRLQEIFQSHDLFANKSVLLVGDLLQLRPVKANYIFQFPSSRKLKPAKRALELWNQFEVYILEENHRQGEDKYWADVLNEIRWLTLQVP